MMDALSAHADVSALPPFIYRLLKYIKKFEKIVALLRFKNKNHPTGIISKITYKLAIYRELKSREYTVLLAPAGSSILDSIADIKTRFPDVTVVYSSDATVDLMQDYYPEFAGMPAKLKSKIQKIEKSAIQIADEILYPSEWAANSAINTYKANPAQVHIIPWGINMQAPAQRERIKDDKVLRLLFVGVDWERKGGAIAVDTLHELRSLGINAHLTIVGCEIPPAVDLKNIDHYRYLNKNNEDESRKLSELFHESDLFLLPTRAECLGIVFCEAASFGLPSVTTNTGGIPSVVINDETGIVLTTDSSGKDFANSISKLLTDPERLNKMRRNAEEYYTNNLNWEAWARKVVELLSNKKKV
jgi:glycosyltransferase involved in cell wall biosynthesis